MSNEDADDRLREAFTEDCKQLIAVVREAGLSEASYAKFVGDVVEALRITNKPPQSVAAAVRKVLATNKWPINRTYDDAGLSEPNYVKFVTEVISQLPAAQPAQWQWRTDDGTWTPADPPDRDELVRYPGRFRALYVGPMPMPTPLLPCPVCGGEAIHAVDVLKRTVIREPAKRDGCQSADAVCHYPACSCAMLADAVNPEKT